MKGRFAALFARLPALRQRDTWWTSYRGLMTSAAVIIAAIVVTATTALASSSSGTRAQDAAATTPAQPPSYLLPIGTLVSNGTLPKPTLAGDTGSAGVPRGTAPRPTAPTTKHATARGQGIAPYRGGSGTLTPAGIATLALQHGCSAAEAPIATAIAMAESGGSPSAQGDIALMTPVWDWSAGLWQIRGLRAERGTGGLRDSIANQNAVTNAAAMYVISDGCTGWGPWSTYTSGAYQSYLGIARQAVGYVLRYYRAHGNHYPTVAPPDPTAVIPSGGGPGGGAAGQASSGGSPAAAPKPASSTSRKQGATSSPARPGSAQSSTTTRRVVPGAPSTKGAAATPTPTKPRILPSITVPPLPLPTKTKIPIPVPTLHLPPLLVLP